MNESKPCIPSAPWSKEQIDDATILPVPPTKELLSDFTDLGAARIMAEDAGVQLREFCLFVRSLFEVDGGTCIDHRFKRVGDVIQVTFDIQIPALSEANNERK